MTRDGTLKLRTIVGIAAVCALIQIPLAAQTEAASPDSPAEPGWITGIVVDGNGDPVEGDLVNALGPREVPEVGILDTETDRRALTDENGAFRSGRPNRTAR